MDGNGVDLRACNFLRRRMYVGRRPTYVWHIDGYDKLKPYGICISGCIGGFSRKIIWLEPYKTNSDPRIIAGYFIHAVTENNGCPQKVWLDQRTTNTHIAVMQTFLHKSEDEYGQEFVILGPSTGNQRTERWWCTLHSECAQFWIDHFDLLKADGSFVDSFIDKSLIQFCFQNTIQVQYPKNILLINTYGGCRFDLCMNVCLFYINLWWKWFYLCRRKHTIQAPGDNLKSNGI